MTIYLRLINAIKNITIQSIVTSLLVVVSFSFLARYFLYTLTGSYIFNPLIAGISAVLVRNIHNNFKSKITSKKEGILAFLLGFTFSVIILLFFFYLRKYGSNISLSYISNILYFDIAIFEYYISIILPSFMPYVSELIKEFINFYIYENELSGNYLLINGINNYNNLNNPSDSIYDPSDSIYDPSDDLNNLSDNLNNPSDNLNNPSDGINNGITQLYSYSRPPYAYYDPEIGEYVMQSIEQDPEIINDPMETSRQVVEESESESVTTDSQEEYESVITESEKELESESVITESEEESVSIITESEEESDSESGSDSDSDLESESVITYREDSEMDVTDEMDEMEIDDPLYPEGFGYPYGYEDTDIDAEGEIYEDDARTPSASPVLRNFLNHYIDSYRSVSEYNRYFLLVKTEEAIKNDTVVEPKEYEFYNEHPHYWLYPKSEVNLQPQPEDSDSESDYDPDSSNYTVPSANYPIVSDGTTYDTFDWANFKWKRHTDIPPISPNYSMDDHYLSREEYNNKYKGEIHPNDPNTLIVTRPLHDRLYNDLLLSKYLGFGYLPYNYYGHGFSKEDLDLYDEFKTNDSCLDPDANYPIWSYEWFWCHDVKLLKWCQSYPGWKSFRELRPVYEEYRMIAQDYIYYEHSSEVMVRLNYNPKTLYECRDLLLGIMKTECRNDIVRRPRSLWDEMIRHELYKRYPGKIRDGDLWGSKVVKQQKQNYLNVYLGMRTKHIQINEFNNTRPKLFADGRPIDDDVD